METTQNGDLPVRPLGQFNIEGISDQDERHRHATEVPTVGIFVQVPLNQRKDERNRAHWIRS